MLRACFLISCLLLVINPTGPSSLFANEIVVYFPDYRYQEASQLNLYGTTQLVLFSAKPKEDGSVDISRLSPKLLPMAAELKETHPDLKILACVGGWSRSKVFANAIATQTSRNRFATQLSELCTDQQIDGIDLDWEFPRTEVDKQNLDVFLRELSSRLRPQGKLLTIALSASYPLAKTSYQYVDQINLMSYQPWNPTNDYKGWLESRVQKLIDSGAPPEKIQVGMPFFTKELGGERRALSWKKLSGPKAQKLPDSNYPFSPIGKDICQLRIEVLQNYQLGGVMIWDYGHDNQDPEHSLLKHLSEKMGK